MADNKLPSIDQIVEERIGLGIAGNAEFQCYMKGYLDDSEYSEETKLSLISEIEEDKRLNL
jgi:hypothetical protein